MLDPPGESRWGGRQPASRPIVPFISSSNSAARSGPLLTGAGGWLFLGTWRLRCAASSPS